MEAPQTRRGDIRADHSGLPEEVLRARMQVRGQLRGELEDQSLRQLRSCAEKFVLKEAGDALRRRGALAAGDVEDADPALPEGAQAAAMASLLRMRQHRHLSDSLRRQFQDAVRAGAAVEGGLADASDARTTARSAVQPRAEPGALNLPNGRLVLGLPRRHAFQYRRRQGQAGHQRAKQAAIFRCVPRALAVELQLERLHLAFSATTRLRAAAWRRSG
ncbi:unnamed protein product [Prorocentrum cordatum]|uniref:Uncharacterized protein n=1 Tax=Prorocentrum cordatum TaxID=2364126 RepID=A0ABN9SLB8_9DINO|nr:unnamed protein product [Polarella glacialis]